MFEIDDGFLEMFKFFDVEYDRTEYSGTTVQSVVSTGTVDCTTVQSVVL